MATSGGVATRPPRLYQHAAAVLLERGVDPLFGLMGDANMHYVAEYRERGGRFVPTVHEAGAVAMADAYARTSGRVGAATVTHGPGLTNTMTALVEAVRSRTPLLLLTGDTPADPTHFQRIDIGAVAAAAGAGHRRVHDPDALEHELAGALHDARRLSRPVLLDIPANLLMREITPEASDAATDPAIAVEVGRETDPAPVVSVDELDAALGLLLSADRPLVLAGRGAVESGARESLVELAELIGAPLATTVLAKDLFAGHPANVGIFGDLAHGVAAAAIGTADTVIAFGAGLNRFTTHHRELIAGKRLVHVDLDPGRYGSYVDADEVVVGDAAQVAFAFVAALRDAGTTVGREVGASGWLPRIRRDLLEHRPGDDFVDRSGAATLDPRTAAITLNAILPTRRNLVSDIGRFVNAAWPYLDVPDPRRFAVMGGFGGIGLGLAGAIGAAIAHPEVTTIAVVGDGGFVMNPAELITAANEELDLIVLVFDDGAYGAEHHKLDMLGIDPRHALTSWPPIARIAEGFGVPTRTVRSRDELDALAGTVARRTGLLVIDIRLDPALDVIT